MLASTRRGFELRGWAKEYALDDTASLPEDWPAKSRLDDNGLIPLSHGDHAVGDSGIYAALNGIRLLAAEDWSLTPKQEHDLLALAWNWRSLRGDARPDRGMRSSEWHRLVEALAYAFRIRHGLYISVSNPWTVEPKRAEFFCTVEKLVIAGSVVSSLMAGGRYTVIRGYTPLSLLLFDSGQRFSVRRSSLGLGKRHSKNRHQLVPTATLVLTRY